LSVEWLASGVPLSRSRGWRWPSHTDGDCEERVVAQGVVVVEVLVAAGEPKDALVEELLDRMLDAPRAPPVFEAVGQLFEESKRHGHFTQQQDPAVTADVAGVECGLDAASAFLVECDRRSTVV